jgi:signal transduction histidine kinase
MAGTSEDDTPRVGAPRGRRAPPTQSGAAPAESVTLTFPDLPRLELDELLVQLVGRAQEVMGTQGRLRELLRAQRLFSGELTLPVVLRGIVRAARGLVKAEYAALGVLGPSGGLVDFIHEGMPEDAVSRIGHLPQGKGLLGALIDDPHPIRLASLARDPRSSGFPEGHLPMESFLGVPIRVRDEVFGNIYVSQSARGEFSAEDEELLSALAATAGVAIDNARLYATARTRGEWLQASAAITRTLLAADADHERALQVVAERIREIAEADLVLLMFPDELDEGRLRIRVSDGVDADSLGGLTVPMDGSFAGQVYRSGEPARVAHLSRGIGLSAVTSTGVEIGPALAAPLAGSRQVHGVLTAARLAGSPGFTQVEAEMVTSFANHAALAIELAEARQEQERAAMLDDRERIAADLHDHVIQRLFAAGLSLQAYAAGLGTGRAADRIQATIMDLDDTIKQIRTSIFRLQQDPRTVSAGVRSRLLSVLAEVSPVLGFDPGLQLGGVLEGTLADEVVEDLLAVLREALTNVGRHAEARSADVAVTVADGRLVLRVRDDGRGMGTTTRRSGLANLRRRAEAHGGSLELAGGQPSGTVLSWTVPLAG